MADPTSRISFVVNSTLVLVATFLFCACNSENETQFTKIDTDDSGIKFVNENHETEKSNILTYEYFYNGGGVAMGDINNDGLTDIYFTSTIYGNKLYLNKGGFEFEDITETSGTACEVGWKTGVSLVDINADGFLDIYVCRSASPDPERRRNILLVNNGDNTFRDRAREFNLDDDSYSTQAAFFDFDRDHDLDVILLNHSILSISNSFLITRRNSKNRYPHVGNRFLKNEGGKFVDVSDSIGIYGPASNYGLGVSLSDVNNDGWIDIYTGCDYTGRDKLLLNNKGKSFIDATDTLSHISKFTMGTDIADVNGDGWMDIFTVDMLPEDNRRQKQLFGSDRFDVYSNMVSNGLHSQYMRNMLHLNNGNGSFSEVGQLAGIANTDWSWGALFADFDNDGIQDLFITNGFKRDLTDNDFAKFRAHQEILTSRNQGKDVSYLEVIEKLNENRIPNYCFQGQGNLAFRDVTKAWGLYEPTLSNGVAYGDLDNDGDLDLVVNNINEGAGVYRNNAEKTGRNFLSVSLSGNDGNRQAIGARVVVHAAGKVIARENLPVRGFQSSVDTKLHFGLGDISSIDSLAIFWPDGSYEVRKNPGINKIVQIGKQQPRNTRPARTDSDKVLFERTEAPDFRHAENSFNDFNVQPLLPKMYSREGPAMAVADVNGDGLNDVFVGGAKGQASELWCGKAGGSFARKVTAFNDSQSEVTDAIFFDADGDKDVDLYVVTGGYEFDRNDPALADRFFRNDGRGGFKEAKLPAMLSSGSCVAAADLENDGDIDLFVGGRIVPGRYPESPESVILINDGKGVFSVDTKVRTDGMITDAIFEDLNRDGFADLVVAGEWMPIRVFINEKGALVNRTEDFISGKTEGLWNCIVAADFDGDGDNDFVVGNQGLNTQMKASDAHPAMLYYGDFDNNGSVDPIMNYFIKDKTYPYPTRDELTEQLPSFKKRFKDYKSYSDAQISDVLTPEELKGAKQLSVVVLESSYLRNDNGKLTLIPLPREMQIAPVTALAVLDANEDGNPDLVTGGNISATRARTGKMTGNFGMLFTGDGKGSFGLLPPLQCGINVAGDVKEIAVDGDRIIFAVNNGPLQAFSRRSKSNVLVKK